MNWKGYELTDKGKQGMTDILHWAIGVLSISGFVAIVTRTVGFWDWVPALFAIITVVSTIAAAVIASILIAYE